MFCIKFHVFPWVWLKFRWGVSLILFYFPPPRVLKGPLGFILNGLPSPCLCSPCCTLSCTCLTDEGWRLFSDLCTLVKTSLAQVKGWLLPGTRNKALVGKFSICLIIALKHSKSQLEGDQLLYQYPGLPKTIASFQWLFPRKAEFPFSSFLTSHYVCLQQRDLPPFVSLKRKTSSDFLWTPPSTTHSLLCVFICRTKMRLPGRQHRDLIVREGYQRDTQGKEKN